MTSKNGKGLEQAETIVAEKTTTSAEASSPTSVPVAGGAEATMVLAGRYELLALVGAGGMGSVYRARDRELDEIVALKMLNAELIGSEAMLERFRREVKLARRIAHPNVARVHDIGEHAGQRFLTMEFIAGQSLGTKLGREPRLSLGRAVSLALGICAGVSAAHAAGVVHRDLKPDNVMLKDDGQPVVTDFGIARSVQQHDVKQTALGAVVGTPAYMAPEQVEGSSVDERTDVYALGVLLFELLTGRLPFEGDSPYVVAAKRLSEPAPDPRQARADIPDAVARVVLTCLARDPAHRYASVDALASALAAAAPTELPASASPARASLAPASTLESAERTVAVLPFTNSGTADDAFVAEGLSEDLIDTLSVTRGLRVKPLAVAAAVAAANTDPQAAGRELGVEVVVSGSVRRRSDTLRVTARVMTVSDGFQLWAERFDRPASDALVISDEVAKAITRALTVESNAPAVRSAPTDPLAIELYLRGRADMRKLDHGSFERAMALFREAHDRAPDDATILAAYARACARAWFYGGDLENLGTRARELSAEAVRRAPSSPESLLVRATVAFADADVSEMAEPLLLARRLAPALAEAHELYGRLRVEVGPVEAGLAALRRAHELDPALEGTKFELARTLALLGSWDEAEVVMKQLREASPSVLLPVLARFALWGHGRETFLSSKIVQPEERPGPMAFVHATRSALSTGRVDQAIDAAIAHASLDSQRPRRFAVFLFQIMAELHAHVGNHPTALVGLQRSVDAGLLDLTWLDHAPTLASLRALDRFAELRAIVAQRAEGARRALGDR